MTRHTDRQDAGCQVSLPAEAGLVGVVLPKAVSWALSGLAVLRATEHNGARNTVAASRLILVQSEAILLTAGHSQESLTRAYIHAIAGHVGLTCSLRDFDYGIDLTLHEVTVRTHPASGRKRYVESGMPLDIQVKSTTNAVARDGTVAYDLDIDVYDDLRTVRAITPRILVLHVQPEAERERLTVTSKGLHVRGLCYWMSLRGFPESSNKSQIRLGIPTAQVFNEESLREIMRRVSEGEPL